MNALIRGAIPVINRRELLFGEFRISRGFVPAHAAYGEIVSAGGIVTALPRSMAPGVRSRREKAPSPAPRKARGRL